MSTNSRDLPAQEQPQPFPVVGIGASAGGLEACIDLLSGLPSPVGMAFVLVQHLEPHYESHLPEILARATEMPVQQAEEGTVVERDKVYVVPPNVMLTIKAGTLRLSPRAESPNQYYGIDHFFCSLAEDQGTRAIGVILSGSSSDGAQGLRAIKCASGTTFCQTESSAKYGGMPHSAIETGAVDFILPPHLIATELATLGAHPYLGLEEGAEAGLGFEQQGQQVQTILALLRDATRVDFTQYKQIPSCAASPGGCWCTHRNHSRLCGLPRFHPDEAERSLWRHPDLRHPVFPGTGHVRIAGAAIERKPEQA